VYSSTAYYIVAYTTDKTKQLLLSLDHSTELAWHSFLASAAERLDEYLNPGPAWADKSDAGSAVEIYLLLSWDLLSVKKIDEFYKMIGARVVFRIVNQCHIPLQSPFVHGAPFRLHAAANPRCVIGARPVALEKAPFYVPETRTLIEKP